MNDGSGIRRNLKGNVDEALRLFAAEAEWAGLNLDETEYVLEETLKCYGATFDGHMIRELFKFYRRYLGMASVSRRQQLLTRMTTFISEGHQSRYVALLCFISADTDGQITSGAALDLAMVTPQDKGDQLTGPKYVAFHGCGGVRAKLGKPGSDDEGDVAAGLFLLGDMRLLPLLEEVWERLTPGGRHRMIRRHSNLVSALAVEFLLRRLEADKAEEYHGELGAALHNLPEIAARMPAAVVLDIRRNFGLPPGKEPMELLGRETLAEAFTCIRPRLQALIDRESEPKVLPNVLATWAKAAGEGVVAPGATAQAADKTEDEDKYKDVEMEEYPEILSQEAFDAFYEGYDDLESPEQVMFYCNPFEVRPITPGELKEQLAPAGFHALLVTGIFNPMGPTLRVFGLQKDKLDAWRLVWFQLNPFSCVKGAIAVFFSADVAFVEGKFDEAASKKRKTLVIKERTTPSLEFAYDVLARIILPACPSMHSFTLCVPSARVSKELVRRTLEGVLMKAAKARDDLDDLRDKKKRRDPWARADMAEAMRRIAEPRPAPALLGAQEAAELAGIVLDLEQRRVEMTNLQAAWEGAIEFSPLEPVMDRGQLLEAMVMLTPDMPNLFNHTGAFHPDDLTGDVPGGATQKSSATPAEPTAGMQSADQEQKAEEAAKGGGTPKYRGILRLIYLMGPLEALLGLGAALWALFCAEWALLLALLVFTALNFLRLGGLSMRDAWTRWFAVGLYGLMLGYVGYRIHLHNLSGRPSGAAFLLLDVLVFWFGPMCFLNLICFDYAKQMREAPDEPA